MQSSYPITRMVTSTMEESVTLNAAWRRKTTRSRRILTSTGTEMYLCVFGHACFWSDSGWCTSGKCTDQKATWTGLAAQTKMHIWQWTHLISRISLALIKKSSMVHTCAWILLAGKWGLHSEHTACDWFTPGFNSAATSTSADQPDVVHTLKDCRYCWLTQVKLWGYKCATEEWQAGRL